MIYIPSICEIEKDIDGFIDSFEGKWPEEFGKYSRFYNIATEAVKEYVEYFDNNIKNALSIGASADQGIALSNKGARNIYFFDVNQADYYFIMLKKCALENLSRNEYIDFIVAEKNKPILNYKLYNKLSKYLEPTIKYFWDNIYKYFNYDNGAIQFFLFRSTKKNATYSRKVNNYYNNNKIYTSTQDNVIASDWNFIPSNLYELDKYLNNKVKYDAIILSNIYEYLNFGDDVSLENAKKYVNYIKNTLIPKLNDNGVMMSAYLCSYDLNMDSIIESKLINSPYQWVSSSNFISGFNNIQKYLQGYTGQNVSYHYLLKTLKEELPHEIVLTKNTGYGASSSNNDMALIYKKTSR